MRKNNIIFGLALVMPLVVLSMSGCITKSIIADEAIIRYQKVAIPSYERLDYEKLITSDNDEVKYNAICNLVTRAPNYATILEKGVLDESSQNVTPQDLAEYTNAKKVFSVVSEELRSKNRSIQAASLIFLTHFSSKYSNKEQLLQLVSAVKTKEVRTQYEQIRALTKLSDSDTVIDKTLIYNFLDSRSWLIKSMTYLLLGEVASDGYHRRLIKEYRNTNAEYDKLLIIHAFRKGYGPEVFDLLKNELLSPNSERIRSQIVRVLKMNNDDTAIIRWIIHDHETMDRAILGAILNEYYSELTSSAGATFFHELLLSGQEQLITLIDQVKFFRNLYNGLENKASRNDLVEIELSVQKNKHLNRAWVTYIDRKNKERLKEQEKEEREQQLMKAVLPKYNAMLEKFLEDSEKLFTNAGMDKKEIEEATESTREFLQFLNKQEAR